MGGSFHGRQFPREAVSTSGNSHRRQFLQVEISAGGNGKEQIPAAPYRGQDGKAAQKGRIKI